MARTRRESVPSARPYHHGNLRRALIDEALATIRRDGVDALTLRGVGARLGVSRTALYRHFADKSALLTEVATEGFRTLRIDLDRAWNEGGRQRDAFNAMGVAYIRFAMASPSHYRVMFGRFLECEAPTPELETEASGAFDVLAGAVAALQADGRVDTGDTLALASFVWAVVHGVAMLGIDGQLRSPDAVEALVPVALDRLWSGIGTAHPPKTSRKKHRDRR